MSRTGQAGLGIGVLALAWGVLPALSLPPFSTHMTSHMSVVAVAAPLLALSMAGSSLDPARAWPRIVSPIPASMLELVVVWAWHVPALHHAAAHQTWVWLLEQASFLGTGMLLWIAALGGGAQRRRRRAIAGVTGLLLTSMHMTLLGALVTLSSRDLYGHGGPVHPWLSPQHDQQLGGAIMLVMGASAYLTGGLWLVGKTLWRRQEATP